MLLLPAQQRDVRPAPPGTNETKIPWHNEWKGDGSFIQFKSNTSETFLVHLRDLSSIKLIYLLRCHCLPPSFAWLEIVTFLTCYWMPAGEMVLALIQQLKAVKLRYVPQCPFFFSATFRKSNPPFDLQTEPRIGTWQYEAVEPMVLMLLFLWEGAPSNSIKPYLYIARNSFAYLC